MCHVPRAFIYKMALRLEERVFIIQKFYQFNKSVLDVQREFDKEFGKHKRPAKSTITR